MSKAAEKAARARESYIKKMRNKLGCSEDDCGTNFVFSIGDNELKHIDDRQQVYGGSCKKCHQTLNLRGNAFHKFCSIFGEPELVVLKSTFNDFFEVTEKKKDVDV